MTTRNGLRRRLPLAACALATALLLLSPFLAVEEAAHHHHCDQASCLICAWIQHAQSALEQAGTLGTAHPLPLLPGTAAVSLCLAGDLRRPDTLILQKIRMND